MAGEKLIMRRCGKERGRGRRRSERVEGRKTREER